MSVDDSKVQIAQLNPQQIFYFQLGRFVTQFSLAESVLFLYLVTLTGIKRHDLNAITGGAKVNNCIDFIRRIYEARDQIVPENIKTCLEKLASINTLRNDLLHKGARSDFTVTNELRELPGRLKTYSVSSPMLEAATKDLAKITFILNGPLDQVTAPARELELMRRSIEGPWLYTPPQPETPDRRKQDKNQEQ